MDELALLPQDEQKAAMAIIKDEKEQINRYSICGKNELKWEVKKLFADFPSLTFIGLELLVKDIIKGIKCRLGKIDRNIAVTSISQNGEMKE